MAPEGLRQNGRGRPPRGPERESERERGRERERERGRERERERESAANDDAECADSRARVVLLHVQYVQNQLDQLDNRISDDLSHIRSRRRTLVAKQVKRQLQSSSSRKRNPKAPRWAVAERPINLN